MNLNDLAMVGAIPYALQNHIVLPKDDHKAILILSVRLQKNVVKKNRNDWWRNFYSLGYVRHGHQHHSFGVYKNIRQNQCKVGDVLVGIKSNGLHSNGITKFERFWKKSQKNLPNRQEFILTKFFPYLINIKFTE